MIDATRHRLSFVGEWATAVAFLLIMFLVGMLAIREFRFAPRAVATPGETVSSAAQAVPADAVSVPTLTLAPNQELRVGDRAEDALAKISSTISLVKRVEELGPLGRRDIRSYQLAGMNFILVLEPFERRGEPRVAGIYMQ
jgi:hypothetical protein